MNRYRVRGTATVDIDLFIEADSLEEAMEIADENIDGLTEFADGTVGLDCEFEHDIIDNGWVEWCEEYSECVEEDI